MIDMPERYQQRVVEIRVGQAVIPGGRPAWRVEEWNTCNCPDCENGEHWFGQLAWFDTREEAEARVTYPLGHRGKAL